jgi:hypothetical protein
LDIFSFRKIWNPDLDLLSSHTSVNLSFAVNSILLIDNSELAFSPFLDFSIAMKEMACVLTGPWYLPLLFVRGGK